jgi:hypothetical protein
MSVAAAADVAEVAAVEAMVGRTETELGPVTTSDAFEIYSLIVRTTLEVGRPNHRHRLLRARDKRHAAAAPPSRVMNSRRFIRSPRRRGRAA